MGVIRPFLARWRWWVTARAARTTSIDEEPWRSCQRAVAWLEAQTWPSGEAFCEALNRLEVGEIQVAGTAPLNVAALARSMRLTWTYEVGWDTGDPATHSARPSVVDYTVRRTNQAASAAHAPRARRTHPRRR